MSRLAVPLTDTKCSNAKAKEKPYKLSDGMGLYLEIKQSGVKTWRFKYKRVNGKEALATFGAYPSVTLKAARTRREAALEMLAQGKDPVNEGRKEKLRIACEQDQTFEIVARKWLSVHGDNVKPAHLQTIQRRLELHLFPMIGRRPISDLTPRDLYRPLLAIEARGSFDLANRVRNYLDSIMRLAIRLGYLESNPVRDLMRSPKISKPHHRPALDLKGLPELLRRIDADTGRLLYRIALKLSLLLFVRLSELRNARWSEIDFSESLWTIPSYRETIDSVKYSERGTKMGDIHEVPLSDQAIRLLKSAYEISGDSLLLFTSDRNKRRPMSEAAINIAIRRMGYDTKKELTGHGFRAMACSALYESGLFSSDSIERQMSHKVRGVRAAYTHKADFIQERKSMMKWWADYLDANREIYISPHEFTHIWCKK